MEGLKARLDSFKKSKKVKSGQKTKLLKWPHPANFKASPYSLAEAGFYYNPSLDDPDNATCYVCAKELGSWEENDDPMAIHWEKCGQTCCWAMVRCGHVFDVDDTGRFISTDKSRNPTSKVLEKMRYETFQVGKGWIHDKEKNHGANSKAMARAGFVFTPESSGDDLVTCFYCSLSLSGWEPEDDPLEQHRQRAEKEKSGCPFFARSSEAKKPSKPASKAQSKPNSRSTSRNAHQDILMPTKEHDGDPETDADSDSGQSIVAKPTAKTPRKGRSTSASSTRKSSAKTPKTKRSTSRSTLKDVVELEEDEDEIMSEAPPPTKKTSRSKSVARSEVTEEEDILQAPPTVKKKARAKSIARPEVNDATGEEDTAETRKPSRSRAKSKAPADSQDEAAVKPSRSKSKASMAPPTDEAARKSSRSKVKAKVQESEQDDDTPVAPVKKKPSHQRTASKAKTKPIDVVSEDNGSDDDGVPQHVPKKKPGKQKPTKPAVQDVFDDDDPMDAHAPPSPTRPPPKPLPSSTDLPPLFIPKRTKVKPAVEEETSAASSSRDQAKPQKPKSKAKSRTPAPQDSRSEREQSTSDELMPLSPVINQQNIALTSKEKLLGKSTSFTNSAFPNTSKHPKLKVVEISSDEDVEETPVKRRTPAPGLQTGKENLRGSRATTEEPVMAPPTELRFTSPVPPKSVKPLEHTPSLEMLDEPSTSPPSPMMDVDIDIDTQDLEQDQALDRPSTPIQPTVPLPSLPKKPSSPMTTDAPKSVDPPIFPALSKLPFAPLTTLSEAELDMTVEEWIRYQMEVEFDKFRRDGERELQRFRKKAEDVRKVIEGL